MPQGRLLPQPLSLGWVAAASFGVNKAALNKVGGFWSRSWEPGSPAAPWVDMAESAVLCFLTSEVGQCSSLTSQRCCAGNGLYCRAINGTEKPAKKGENSQVLSSVLARAGKRDRGLHNDYHGEE